MNMSILIHDSLSDVHSWFFLYEPSDKLHLAALNPPAQFHKLNRLEPHIKHKTFSASFSHDMNFLD